MNNKRNNLEESDEDEFPNWLEFKDVQNDFSNVSLNEDTKTEDVNPPTNLESISKIPRKQLIILGICCISNFFSMMCVSLQAPFYPKQAEAKGASHIVAGFVFGIYQLTFFIMALVYGSWLSKMGPRRTSIAAIVLMGLGTTVFGLLDYIEDPTTFIVFSFLIRILQANGNAAFVTATFAIITNEFPQAVAKSISYMETAAGLGLLVGPSVGGVLYDVGGFPLPFFINGVQLLLAGVAAFFFLPEDLKNSNKAGGAEGSMRKLFAIPTVGLAAFSIFVGSAAVGYLFPTLEPHLNQFLSASSTGLVFIIDGAMYACFNPLWGWLCDKFPPRKISLVGASLILIGFSLIGPVSFLPWSPTLWVTCVGCAVYGLGIGATFVSGFVQGLSDAKLRGFPDNVSTYGLVSGMWCSVMSLGTFTGAIAGGALYDYCGFQDGIYLILVLEALVAAMTVAALLKVRPF